MQARLQEWVDRIAAEWAFPEAFLRSSKVGARLDVEIDFVVDAGSRAQTVQDFDLVRAQLHDAFKPLGFSTWITVSFTGDRKWAI